jgi:hypothetical protein
MKTMTRPRTAACQCCGQPIHLVRCGVDEHLRTRTRREQIAGRCAGRVYVHAGTGGIECDDGIGEAH